MLSLARTIKGFTREFTTVDQSLGDTVPNHSTIWVRWSNKCVSISFGSCLYHLSTVNLHSTSITKINPLDHLLTQPHPLSLSSSLTIATRSSTDKGITLVHLPSFLLHHSIQPVSEQIASLFSCWLFQFLFLRFPVVSTFFQQRSSPSFPTHHHPLFSFTPSSMSGIQTNPFPGFRSVWIILYSLCKESSLSSTSLAILLTDRLRKALVSFHQWQSTFTSYNVDRRGPWGQKVIEQLWAVSITRIGWMRSIWRMPATWFLLMHGLYHVELTWHSVLRRGVGKEKKNPKRKLTQDPIQAKQWSQPNFRPMIYLLLSKRSPNWTRG